MHWSSKKAPTLISSLFQLLFCISLHVTDLVSTEYYQTFVHKSCHSFLLAYFFIEKLRLHITQYVNHLNAHKRRCWHNQPGVTKKKSG